MSLIHHDDFIDKRVQKAIRRAQGLDLRARRQEMLNKYPLQVASEDDLERRKRFLLETLESHDRANIVFERIIHGNELQDVNYFSKGKSAARAIGRISIRDEFGRVLGHGTGFLIGEGVLLTNNHVLRTSEVAKNSIVEFDFEKDEFDRNKPIAVFGLDPDRLFFTHKGLDFTIVATDPIADNSSRSLDEFGFLPLIGTIGKAVVGEWLTIIQHPGGEMKQVCVRENRLLKKAPNVLWYSTDTLGGSSGSPVFNNDWQVVALHHSGVPDVDEQGRWRTVGGDLYDSRIHGETDIKWLANEGIRASRIVQTLQSDVGENLLVKALLNHSHSPPTSKYTSTPIQKMSEPREIPKVNLLPKSYILEISDEGHPSIRKALTGDASEADSLGGFETEPFLWESRSGSRSSGGVRFTFDDDYSNRSGYDEDFLAPPRARGKHRVNLPVLTPGLKASAVRLLEPEDSDDFVLKYTGMSLVMHQRRRFAMFSAANVDYARRYAWLKSKRVWRYDPRIPLEAQVADEVYGGNRLDRGHITRQEDMEYGDTVGEALQSAADTCHWTNVFPQHDKFNRTKRWWQGIEQHILEKSVTANDGGFRAQVFTGPVFSERDPVYSEAPGVQIPMKFWKVVAAVNSSDELFATAYLLDQSPVILKYGLDEARRVPFGAFKFFQLPIAELENMIHMKFTQGANGRPLSDSDPLKGGRPPKLDADQDGRDDRQESFTNYDADSEDWINLIQESPYLG